MWIIRDDIEPTSVNFVHNSLLPIFSLCQSIAIFYGHGQSKVTVWIQSNLSTLSDLDKNLGPKCHWRIIASDDAILNQFSLVCLGNSQVLQRKVRSRVSLAYLVKELGTLPYWGSALMRTITMKMFNLYHERLCCAISATIFVSLKNKHINEHQDHSGASPPPKTKQNKQKELE